jgi:hypothetical protein
MDPYPAGSERNAMTTTKVPEARAPQPTEAAEPQRVITVGHGALLRAVQQSIEENSVTMDIAGVAKVRLPAVDSLAFIGGLAALGALGLLEWPVAAVLGLGHVLAHQRHLQLLQSFGKALEEA